MAGFIARRWKAMGLKAEFWSFWNMPMTEMWLSSHQFDERSDIGKV
jgi:hypothetical protein